MCSIASGKFTLCHSTAGRAPPGGPPLHNARDLSHDVQEIAQMHREVAFMIRRQYGDIDRDLQEIKELLGGQ